MKRFVCLLTLAVIGLLAWSAPAHAFVGFRGGFVAGGFARVGPVAGFRAGFDVGFGRPAFFRPGFFRPGFDVGFRDGFYRPGFDVGFRRGFYPIAFYNAGFYSPGYLPPPIALPSPPAILLLSAPPVPCGGGGISYSSTTSYSGFN